MRIPASNDPQISFSPPAITSARSVISSLYYALSQKNSAHGWSSLIGIITAIIGNVLISIALNTQRYAHLRLERDSNGADEAHKLNGRTSGYGSGDGSGEEDIADHQAKLNRHSSHIAQDGYVDDINSRSFSETDPLIPPHQKNPSDEEASTSSASSEQSHNAEKKHYLRSPWWWLGISLMVVGEAGNFLAYGFAPASIVSPLGVVALISNCLIAPIMLHEKFRRRDLLGILVAVGGAVTVVLSANMSNPKLGADEIWDLIKRWEFLTYLGVCTGLIVILSVASNKVGHKIIVIDIGLVGLYGGFTALSTKGIASLLSYKFWRVVTFPITYLLIAILAFTAVMQIKYVNRALQRFDSTQVIPTQFVTFTIFVILGSAILYRDFESATAKQVGQFVGGCALTFLGVWVITSGRSKNNNNNDSNNNNSNRSERRDEDDEDGRIIMIDEEDLDHTHAEPVTPKIKSLGNTSLDDSPASFQTALSRVTAPRPPRIESVSSPLLPSHAQIPPADDDFPPSEDSLRLKPPTPAQELGHQSSTPSRRRSRPEELSKSSVDLDSLSRLRSRLLKTRNSVSHILPRQFTSPLSGGLSGVFADAQRKETERLKRNNSNRGRRSSRTGLVDVFAPEHTNQSRSMLPVSSTSDPLHKRRDSE